MNVSNKNENFMQKADRDVACTQNHFYLYSIQRGKGYLVTLTTGEIKHNAHHHLCMYVNVL